MNNPHASAMNRTGPRRQSPGPAHGAVAKVRAAAVAFARAWGRPQKAERDENLRVYASLATLTFIAALVGVGAYYDASTTRWATKLSPEMTWFFARVTHLGLSGYVFALTVLVTLGALLARRRGGGRRRDAALAALASWAFYLFVVAAVSGIVSQVLKHCFGRARPKLLDIVGPMHFDAFTFNATYASFPSGHAVTAFALAVGLGAIAPKWRLPMLAIAALVAASRVVLGAHYLSDVLAGAALGYACAVLVRRAFAARRIAFRRAGKLIVARGAGLWSAPARVRN